MSKKVKIGKKSQAKSFAKRAKERGWTELAPGIWQGPEYRPFVGPLTVEDQKAKNYYEKLFSDIVQAGEKTNRLVMNS